MFVLKSCFWFLIARLPGSIRKERNLYTGTMGYMFEKVDKYLIMQSLWMVSKNCLLHVGEEAREASGHGVGFKCHMHQRQS